MGSDQLIQQFSEYLIKINPYLQSNQGHRQGELVHRGDVVMLGTPDFTFQQYQIESGSYVRSGAFLDRSKKNQIDRVFSANSLKCTSDTTSFDTDTLFRFLGYINNGAGTVDLETMMFGSTQVKSGISQLERFLGKSLEMAEKGHLDERLFRTEYSRKMQEISKLGGKRFSGLYHDYKQAMGKNKSIVGNLGGRTFNKKIIKLPRWGRRNIDLTVAGNVTKNGFEWYRKGGKIFSRLAIGHDIGLRIRDIKNSDSKLRETVVQACGLGASYVSAEFVGSFCVTVTGATTGAGAVACAFVLGSGIIPLSDDAGKFLCGWAYDGLTQ